MNRALNSLFASVMVSAFPLFTACKPRIIESRESTGMSTTVNGRDVIVRYYKVQSTGVLKSAPILVAVSTSKAVESDPTFRLDHSGFYLFGVNYEAVENQNKLVVADFSSRSAKVIHTSLSEYQKIVDACVNKDNFIVNQFLESIIK